MREIGGLWAEETVTTYYSSGRSNLKNYPSQFEMDAPNGHPYRENNSRIGEELLGRLSLSVCSMSTDDTRR